MEPFMKHTVILLLAAGIFLVPLSFAFGQMAVIPASPAIPTNPVVMANAQGPKTSISFSDMNCSWNYVVLDSNGDRTGSCSVTGDVTFSLPNGQSLNMSGVKLASFPMNITQEMCSAICNGATSGCP